MKTSGHRAAILASAVKLFRQKGYTGVGLNEILADSRAPKGSLYHYFPGGKVEIGLAALESAADKVQATLTELAQETDNPEELVGRYLRMVGQWMRQSNYRDGSPITTIILELVPDEDRIRNAAAMAFDTWAAVLESAAIKSGIPRPRAAILARFSISMIEGALVQCRVSCNERPLKEAASQLEILFKAARRSE